MSTYPFDDPAQEETLQRPPGGQPTRTDWGGQQSTGREQQLFPRPPGDMPNVDLVDEPERIEVLVDLPGFSKEDIKLRGDESNLIIVGERTPEIDEGQTVLVQERPLRIERTLQLPVPVDVSDAEARYDDGVCIITLPKTAAEQYKEIRFD